VATRSTAFGMDSFFATVRVREGNGDGPTVQLLTSGVAVPWAIEAVDLLYEKWVSAPTPGR
jgi:hypothetical protein